MIAVKHSTVVVEVHDVVEHCDEEICAVGVGIPFPKFKPTRVTLASTEVGMFTRWIHESEGASKVNKSERVPTMALTVTT
jgi:hypothetical protein